MNTAVTKTSHDLGKQELLTVLQNSIYPGATLSSIELVLGYCTAAKLDPLTKPVYIVPMWDRDAGKMRDVIMPGIGLYRIMAARSNQYAGMSEPEFGPDVTETLGGATITYPSWCKVTVKRMMENGTIAEFSAVERWKENYAVKGGKEKSIAPNAMWSKRPYGQLAKCAQAQALRMGFPEHVGATPTAEEMEGKQYYEVSAGTKEVAHAEDLALSVPDEQGKNLLEACGSIDALKRAWSSLTVAQRATLNDVAKDCARRIREADTTIEQEVEAA